MKIVQNLIVAATIPIILASCVSTKKFQAQKADKEILMKELSEATSKLDALQNKVDEINKNLKNRNNEMAKLKKMVLANDAKTEKMMKDLKQALTGYSGSEISVDIKDGKVYLILANKLLYKSGSDLLDQAGKDAIAIVADVFKKNQGLDILIEGHTDNVSINNKKYKDNWDLSVARATNVVRYLEGQGVKPTRLTAAGRGEFAPIAENNTAENKQKNRRTEIVISPKMDEIYQLLKFSN